MTATYGMLRENARRTASPCTLAAPLREAWQAESQVLPNWRGSCPPVLVCDSLLFFTDKSGYTVALDVDSQKPIWRYPWTGDPWLIHEGRLYIKADEHELHAVELPTGKPMATIRCSRFDQLLAAGRHLIGHGADHEYGGQRTWVIDWTSGQRLWTEHLPESDLSVSAACATEDVLVYCIEDRTPSSSSATLVARRIRDFHELWRIPVASLTGFAAVDQDLVLGSFGGQITAINLETGAVAWQRPGGEIYVYGGRCYSLSRWTGKYEILDVVTGKAVKSYELWKGLPKNLQSERLSRIALVTETHVFIASEEASLVAFTRDDARYVWRHKPPAAQMPGEVVCAGGRLYYCNGLNRLFCLEPTPSHGAKTGRRVGSPYGAGGES